MIRIQKDISVETAMDEILDGYAATPPSDYKKQLRFQIRRTAMENEGFRNSFEHEVEDEFTGSPRLDEIEDLINEMPPTLAELLDKYGIREMAEKVAKRHKYAEGGAK